MITAVDTDYGYLLSSVLNYGERVETRNGAAFRSLNLRTQFYRTPLISIRKTAWKNALREMEWFLSGSSNINDLHESVRSWWEPWAAKDGTVHNNYGKQFRAFNAEGTWQNDGGGGSIPGSSFDQIEHLVEAIKADPMSRRLVITTWNTADMADVRTPITNCHGSLIQAFYSFGRLSLSMTQRSADLIVGVPHNWIQYWAFLLWLAKRVGLSPGELCWSGGDCHIYEAHQALTQEILDTLIAHDEAQRTEAAEKNELPKILYPPELILKASAGEKFRADDFELAGEYQPVLPSRAALIV